MNSMLSPSTPQRHRGREPVSAFIPLIYFSVWQSLVSDISLLLLWSFGPSQWGPGIVSRHSRAGCSAEGHWRLGRIRGSLYRNASCNWNHFAHAVQLPAPLVGERAWELPRDGGSALHWRHIGTSQPAAGQHHENCSQQLGYWWGLLDEEVGWWETSYTLLVFYCVHLGMFIYRWGDTFCFLSKCFHSPLSAGRSQKCLSPTSSRQWRS